MSAHREACRLDFCSCSAGSGEGVSTHREDFSPSLRSFFTGSSAGGVAAQRDSNRLDMSPDLSPRNVFQKDC